MRNIFLLYIPLGNAEAMVHYEDTIRNKVAMDRILPNVGPPTARKLGQVFGSRSVAVWGSRDGDKNRATFDRMTEGDEIIIVEGPSIKLLGRVVAKVVSPALSQKLWRNLRGQESEGWDLIYFIANPREMDLPFSHFKELLGYEPGFQLRGFTGVAHKLLTRFYQQYDDLYSVLLRIQEGRGVERVPEPPIIQETAPVGGADSLYSELPATTPSDHLNMQWLLLKMGRQAGQKVWAPRGDQSRITAKYDFEDFEETFAAGLDTQVKYVENIDVVWKEEFRIDAAFEVENSTSIYSGLLRFADLTMVAPNTIYPLFIVAPSERRNRVREQLERPSFRHLKIAEKVRYLSYEKVREIEDFFCDAGTGLSADVLVAKSEKLQT